MGKKLIHLDDVEQLLAGGVPLDEVCRRIGVQERSVLRAVERARAGGREEAAVRLVRAARARLVEKRQVARDAKRRRWMYGGGPR